MTRLRLIGGVAVLLTLASASVTVAAQPTPTRSNDRQVKDVLNRIDERTDTFRSSFNRAIDRDPNPINGTRAEDRVNQSVKDFEQATDRLRDRINDRESGTADVEEVLRADVEDVLGRASLIDRFMMHMQRHRLSAHAENDWLRLRHDVDDLARAYHVAWKWRHPQYMPGGLGTGLHHRLTGTYQLESNRGDDPRLAAEKAARTVSSDRRQATYQNLMNRLEAPNVIAIDRNENHVQIASSRSPRVVFEANGRSRTEWGPDGSLINTRATLYGDQLIVATTGNWGNDYSVTFEETDDGLSLRLTRHIYDADLAQPVTVQCFYRRSSRTQARLLGWPDEAKWDVGTWTPRDPVSTDSEAGHRRVPNGTRLVATLNDDLSTQNAREGDRFTLTIRSPSQYRNAVIGGFVTGVNGSGRFGGRSEMSLDLQTIRLRDGRDHDFDGVIVSVWTPDGETIRVNGEGTVEQDSRTEETVQRGVIGAAIGAVIGATTGAGGGGSTVILEGRDRLDLGRGTAVTILSGASGSRRVTTNLGR